MTLESFAKGIVVNLGVMLLAAWSVSLLADLRQEPGFAVECLGEPTAAHRVVYLHGLDTHGPSWVELQNRDKLRVIAAILNIRVALPRAPRRVWPTGARAQAERSLPWISAAAAQCFQHSDTYGLVAFSNGGFAANELVDHCLSHGADWVISIGSAGHVGPTTSSDLSGCGNLTLLIGRYDPSLLPCERYAQSLARRHAAVDVVRYEDVHRVPFRELYDLLQRRLENESTR